MVRWRVGLARMLSDPRSAAPCNRMAPASLTGAAFGSPFISRGLRRMHEAVHPDSTRPPELCRREPAFAVLRPVGGQRSSQPLFPGSGGLLSMIPANRTQPKCDGSVEVIDPADVPEWDERVLQFPDASVFHSRGWMEVLRQSYDHRPCFLVHRRDDEWQGIFPVAEVHSRLTGCRGVALPFSDFSPPLASDPTVLDSLWQTAFTLGTRRNWRYLDTRGGDSPDGDAASIEYHAHVLDLTPSLDELFAGFKPTLRTAIRKAQKAGITVETAQSHEAVREFHRLQVMTRRSQGVPLQPASFFDNLHQFLIATRCGEIVLARREGTAIAGAVYLWLGGRAVFKFGASDPRWLASRSNNLVMWAGIQSCRSRGIQSLHLGRTSIQNAGLRRFKLAWGAAETRLSYHRRDCRTKARMQMRDMSVGWHNRLIAWLPLPALRAVGSVLYRHIG